MYLDVLCTLLLRTSCVGLQSTRRLCGQCQSLPRETQVRLGHRLSIDCLVCSVGGICRAVNTAAHSPPPSVPHPLSPSLSPGTLTATIEHSPGDSLTPQTAQLMFTHDSSTLSGLQLSIKSDAYRISLLKQKLSTGRYEAEPQVEG